MVRCGASLPELGPLGPPRSFRLCRLTTSSNVSSSWTHGSRPGPSAPGVGRFRSFSSTRAVGRAGLGLGAQKRPSGFESRLGIRGALLGIFIGGQQAVCFPLGIEIVSESWQLSQQRRSLFGGRAGDRTGKGTAGTWGAEGGSENGDIGQFRAHGLGLGALSASLHAGFGERREIGDDFGLGRGLGRGLGGGFVLLLGPRLDPGLGIAL